MKRTLISLFGFMVCCVITKSLTAKDDESSGLLEVMAYTCVLFPEQDPMCVEVAEIIGPEIRSEESRQIALKYLTQSCERNNAFSCGLLGAAYKDGINLPKDQNKAYQFMEKGCDLQGLESCLSMAIWTDSPKYSKVPLDGCNNKDAKSCFYLGKIHYHGYGFDQNVEKGFELYRMSCELGHKPACDEFAR